MFCGSPSEEGITIKLLHEIVSGAESRGMEIKWYNLNEEGIRGCQGCFYCQKNEGCIIKDDSLAPMYNDIKHASAILFGSPIYFYDISGQAKIWLDRMFPMVVGMKYKPRYPGKKIATVYVQGNANVTENEQTISKLNGFFQAFGWQLIDSIVCGGTSNPLFILPKCMKKRAYEIGVALAE